MEGEAPAYNTGASLIFCDKIPSMKILILGAGNLGAALAKTFEDLKPVVWDKADLDITDAPAARQKITALKPELILNAAAFTDTAAAETTRRAEALAVNATAVGLLAEIARDIGALFAHYSTDYVFHGNKKAGYTETDVPSEPVNYYGVTKLEGEKLMLRAFGASHERIKNQESRIKNPFYLIRTSWLFAPMGKSFPAAMLKLAETKPEIPVVNDQYGKPTYAPDLAKATRALINDQAPFGLYHLVNEPTMTWYDFAQLIFDTKASLDPKFSKPIVKPVSSSVFPSPIKRPAYSILLNTKQPPLRPIKEALVEFLNHATCNMNDGTAPAHS